jgi:hypothetical protein
MDEREKNVIKSFAAGDESLRHEATAIYVVDLEKTKEARGTPEKDFMAEVTSKCPDLALRASYRKKLLTGE